MMAANSKAEPAGESALRKVPRNPTINPQYLPNKIPAMTGTTILAARVAPGMKGFGSIERAFPRRT